MAWLTSKTGRLYYYRRRKVNGRVLSEYVGGGEVALLVARLDAIERAKREAKRHNIRHEQTQEDDLDRQIDHVGDELNGLVTAVLLVGGYHQHKREWRKRRGCGD